MTPAHFLVAAAALVMAFSHPTSVRNRYTSRATLEATDPGKEQNDDRQKRAYSSWSDYAGFSRWKPATTELSRPYYIPIYGSPGKVPIYFPPQKLLLNPGTPKDNPLPNRPFKGPIYLPPTTEKPTTMIIMNRFNEDDEDDERPVWGGGSGGASVNQPAIVPTRPPRPPGMPEFPPLVHDITSGGTNALASDTEDEKSFITVSRSSTPSPIIAGPSNCAWAIVSCCSASTNKVPDSCFEQRGCPGPFWGSSPCDSDFAKAAIASALNYYSPDS